MGKHRKKQDKEDGRGALPGNDNASKYAMPQVKREVTGLAPMHPERAARAEQLAQGILSDLAALRVQDLPTGKQLVLEGLKGKVEIRRTYDAYLNSQPTLEDYLAAGERLLNSGHYLALSHSIREDCRQLGIYERHSQDVTPESQGEALRASFTLPASTVDGQEEAARSQDGAPYARGRE